MTTARPAADPQQHAVYAWEREHVERPLGNEVLGWDDATMLALHASSWLRIPVPAIRSVRSESLPCFADPWNWTLSISDWGRTRPVLMHEMAHLGTLPELRQGEAPHGAAFVGTVIALYSCFLGMDTARLLASAAHCGLTVSIPCRLPVAPATPKKRRFRDIDL
jgi:hypothetical protein